MRSKDTTSKRGTGLEPAHPTDAERREFIGERCVSRRVRTQPRASRTRRREAWSSYRNSTSRERELPKRKYCLQPSVIAALPVAGRDRKQLRRQLALRQTIGTRALKSPRSNGWRLERPGIPAPGATSLQAAPPSATPVRFDLCSNESGNATVPARKRSCEILRDGVEMQFGDPKAKRSALQVDITS